MYSIYDIKSHAIIVIAIVIDVIIVIAIVIDVIIVIAIVIDVQYL